MNKKLRMVKELRGMGSRRPTQAELTEGHMRAAEWDTNARRGREKYQLWQNSKEARTARKWGKKK